MVIGASRCSPISGLIILGIGIAMTGLFPQFFYGLLLTTTIMSIGFHYFEDGEPGAGPPAAASGKKGGARRARQDPRGEMRRRSSPPFMAASGPCIS